MTLALRTQPSASRHGLHSQTARPPGLDHWSVLNPWRTTRAVHGHVPTNWPSLQALQSVHRSAHHLDASLHLFQLADLGYAALIRAESPESRTPRYLLWRQGRLLPPLLPTSHASASLATELRRLSMIRHQQDRFVTSPHHMSRARGQHSDAVETGLGVATPAEVVEGLASCAIPPSS